MQYLFPRPHVHSNHFVGYENEFMVCRSQKKFLSICMTINAQKLVCLGRGAEFACSVSAPKNWVNNSQALGHFYCHVGQKMRAYK